MFPEIPTEEAVGDKWVGGDVNAGDVLIFHSLTVHAGFSEPLGLSSAVIWIAGSRTRGES